MQKKPEFFDLVVLDDPTLPLYGPAYGVIMLEPADFSEYYMVDWLYFEGPDQYWPPLWWPCPMLDVIGSLSCPVGAEKWYDMAVTFAELVVSYEANHFRFNPDR